MKITDPTQPQCQTFVFSWSSYFFKPLKDAKLQVDVKFEN